MKTFARFSIENIYIYIYIWFWNQQEAAVNPLLMFWNLQKAAVKTFARFSNQISMVPGGDAQARTYQAHDR